MTTPCTDYIYSSQDGISCSHRLIWPLCGEPLVILLNCVYVGFQGGDTVKVKVQLSHFNKLKTRVTFAEHSLELEFQTR